MRTIDISTRFIPATDRHGAKVRALDKTGRSITIPHPYELSGDEKSLYAISRFLRQVMPTAILAGSPSGFDSQGHPTGATGGSVRLARSTPSGFAWKVDIMDECQFCAGHGVRVRRPEDPPETCTNCDGEGYI